MLALPELPERDKGKKKERKKLKVLIFGKSRFKWERVIRDILLGAYIYIYILL